jgi:quercetin dioxygenase-like cupin family protein
MAEHQLMKNIDKKTVLTLKDEVTYQTGQVVSKTLAQNDAVSVTLFAFDAGEQISSHKAAGDAFITCLDGEGVITIDDDKFTVTAGNSIVIPAGAPHAVDATTQYKMMLVVIY